jgi:hypothetical protein
MFLSYVSLARYHKFFDYLDWYIPLITCLADRLQCAMLDGPLIVSARHSKVSPVLNCADFILFFELMLLLIPT